MSGAYADFSLILALAWLLGWLLRTGLPARRAVPAGLILAALVILGLRHSPPVLILASVLAPFSVGLSIAILRSLATPFVTVKPVPTWELALISALFAAYLAASAGATRFDPYAFGYAPLTAGGIALAVTAYAGLRGYLLYALTPVLAQVMWRSGIGSSNYLDHLFHGFLLPVMAIALGERIIGLARRRGG